MWQANFTYFVDGGEVVKKTNFFQKSERQQSNSKINNMLKSIAPKHRTGHMNIKDKIGTDRFRFYKAKSPIRLKKFPLKSLLQGFPGSRIFSLQLTKTKYGKLSNKLISKILQIVPRRQATLVSKKELAGGSAALNFREKNRQKDQRILRILVYSMVILAVLAVGGVGVNYLVGQNRTCYALAVDGQEVLLFSSESAVTKALGAYAAGQLPAGCEGLQTDYKQKLTVVPNKAKGRELSTEQEIAQTLAAKVTVLVLTKAITVDGEAVAALPNEQAALAALDEVKKHYYPTSADVAVADAKFRESVTITDYWAAAPWVKTKEQAVASILGGDSEEQKHTVADGESFWTIAKKYGVTVAQLQASNSDVNSEKIKPGQEIRLTQYKPVLRVVVVLETTQNNAVQYATTYVNDSSMLRGKSTVKTEGKNGEEKVTYQIVQENGQEITRQRLATTVIAAAQNKVVQRGTKIVVASRGSGSGGTLAWPLVGAITSRYGYRNGELHPAIDIDGHTGDSVRAAAEGTVIKAGYYGNYGNMIKVDHGGGLVTMYAHLSKIKVSVGDTVSAGQVIGLVGSTGNSTGSHLHFEVIINGKEVNPINYLP